MTARIDNIAPEARERDEIGRVASAIDGDEKASQSKGGVVGPLLAALLLGGSWALMWTQNSFWNPLFFTGTWVGAALFMYTLRPAGYPGWRTHASLALLSVALWWWFEFVNRQVGNWEYVNSYQYDALSYFLFASVAFSTVVPALHAAWGITIGRLCAPESYTPPGRSVWFVTEAVVGTGMLALVFGSPTVFFPVVWIGPFLVVDGVVGYDGGRSITSDLVRGRWRLAVAVGLGGLVCGLLWEFWNFWAVPKWEYRVPYFDFLHLFEMPILGYAGYIPFAWSVYQLLHVRQLRRFLESRHVVGLR